MRLPWGCTLGAARTCASSYQPWGRAHLCRLPAHRAGGVQHTTTAASMPFVSGCRSGYGAAWMPYPPAISASSYLCCTRRQSLPPCLRTCMKAYSPAPVWPLNALWWTAHRRVIPLRLCHRLFPLLCNSCRPQASRMHAHSTCPLRMSPRRAQTGRAQTGRLRKYHQRMSRLQLRHPLPLSGFQVCSLPLVVPGR